MNDSIFGYMFVDNKLVPHPIESEIVKYSFKRVVAYTETPPEVLVREVLACAAENNETLTYEEAKQRVTLSAIEEYVTKEIYAVPEWRDHLESKCKLPNNRLVGALMQAQSYVGKIEPLIDAQTWEKVQAAIKAE